MSGGISSVSLQVIVVASPTVQIQTHRRRRRLDSGHGLTSNRAKCDRDVLRRSRDHTDRQNTVT